jgi:hypothetical protein
MNADKQSLRINAYALARLDRGRVFPGWKLSHLAFTASLVYHNPLKFPAGRDAALTVTGVPA